MDRLSKAERMEAEGRRKVTGWRKLNTWNGYETRGQAKARREKAERERREAGEGFAVLSEGERSRILAEVIAERTEGFNAGWHVQRRDANGATLINPAGDPIGMGGTVMAFATLGLSLMAHKPRRGRENDKYQEIYVHPSGMVETTGDWLLSGKDYRYMREVESGLGVDK